MRVGGHWPLFQSFASRDLPRREEWQQEYDRVMTLYRSNEGIQRALFHPRGMPQGAAGAVLPGITPGSSAAVAQLPADRAISGPSIYKATQLPEL
ncbi:TPA: hypothetical protein ACH3X1_007889 [Trebouxia sp. C0004]